MRLITVLWCFKVLLCLMLNKSNADSSGTFTIDNSGVKGQGTYRVINGVVEISIGLKLEIGTASDKPNDGVSTTTTSLPNHTPLAPTNNEAGSPPSPKSDPTLLALPNAGTISSIRPNTESTSLIHPSNEPSSPLIDRNIYSPPSSSKTAEKAPEIILTPEDKQFIDEMVTVHNKLRSVHFSPPIQSNTDMSIEAKTLALSLAREKDLRHSLPSERPNEGESLAMGCTTAPGPGISTTEAISKWYEEACCDDFSNHAFQNVSGHFTQLVWKATEEIGVGRAFGSKWGMNCTFIVARYRPKGNIDSETAFKDNVEKGTFDPAVYNCSTVNCANIVAEDSQINQVPIGNQQQFRLPDKFSKSRLSGYWDPHAKDLGGGLRDRGANSFAKISGLKSNSLMSRFKVYRLNPAYNEEERLPQFFSSDFSEDHLRPRGNSYRANIPHSPTGTQEDHKVVWFLL